MENIIGELLPYVKGFAGLYIAWNIIAGIFYIGFTAYIFKSIIKVIENLKIDGNKKK